MTQIATQSNTVVTETANSSQTIDGQHSAGNAGSVAAQLADKAFQGIRNALEQLATEREAWENTHVRTANEYLYALLQKCYQLFRGMEGNTEAAKALRTALKDYFALKGYQYRPSSHTMNKIVRCVFAGSNETIAKYRVSSYAIALRAALVQSIAVENIPMFLTESGGVEALRASVAGRPTKSVTEKAVLGSQAVSREELGPFSHQSLGEKFDAGKTDQHVVLLGTWQADGSVTVRAVVEGKGAVNAALASYHSAKKAEAVARIAEEESQAIKATTDKAVRDAANEAYLSKLVNG